MMIDNPKRPVVSVHARPRAKERRRVAAMLDRDRAEAAREIMREIAAAQVEQGAYQNISDTVIPPTQEWLEKGETMPFRPSLPDEVRNSVANPPKTVRRVQNAYILRLYRSNRIDEDQAKACVWYRETYEQAGLEGRCVTTRFQADSARGVPSFGHMPATATEAQARLAIREARLAIGDPLAFFEKVVIDDMPLEGAAVAHARFGRRKAMDRFKAMLSRLQQHLDKSGDGNDTFHGQQD